jgi:hypothetical protein
MACSEPLHVDALHLATVDTVLLRTWVLDLDPNVKGL